jgi:signal peptidase II
MDSVLRKNLFLFLLFGSLILVSDQLSKILVRLNGGFYICNPHIAFGLKIPEVLFWIFWCGIIFWIFYLLYKERTTYTTFCLILIFSGAISNLIDRLWLGCIIDFINLGFWPVFNLADFFITLGAIMVIINYLKVKR